MFFWGDSATEILLFTRRFVLLSRFVLVYFCWQQWEAEKVDPLKLTWQALAIGAILVG